MLVPLDLAALAWKQCRLTPELALGWRLGRHAHDCFNGLNRVRIAATGHVQTLAALERLARFPEPGRVFRPTGARPWDMLFWHEPTATALKVVCIRRRTTLPASEKRQEEKHPLAMNRTQETVDGLVNDIVNGDLASLCVVSEIRSRVLDVEKSKLPASCPWCQSRSFDRLVEVDGRIGCPACSGLEPDWLV